MQWKHRIIISYCHWKGLCYRQMPNEVEPWKTKWRGRVLNLREGWCLETWKGKKRLWTVRLLRMYSFSNFQKNFSKAFESSFPAVLASVDSLLESSRLQLVYYWAMPCRNFCGLNVKGECILWKIVYWAYCWTQTNSISDFDFDFSISSIFELSPNFSQRFCP